MNIERQVSSLFEKYSEELPLRVTEGLVERRRRDTERRRDIVTRVLAEPLEKARVVRRFERRALSVGERSLQRLRERPHVFIAAATVPLGEEFQFRIRLPNPVGLVAVECEQAAADARTGGRRATASAPVRRSVRAYARVASFSRKNLRDRRQRSRRFDGLSAEPHTRWLPSRVRPRRRPSRSFGGRRVCTSPTRLRSPRRRRGR